MPIDYANIVKSDVQLGKGSYGEVFEGSYFGAQVAIKIMLKADVSIKEFVREVKILQEIKHPCCVNLIGYIIDPQPMMIIELYPHNLSQLITKFQLTLDIQKNIARDIISGLMYLHSIPIIHKDIKSNNILITKDFSGRIADFGISKFMSTNSTTRLVGTPFYLAPESFRDLLYSQQSDKYALGITLWEIFELNPQPFHHVQEFFPLINIFSVLRKIHEQNIRPLFSNKMQDLPHVQLIIQQLWDPDPNRRVNLSTALAAIENIDLSSLNANQYYSMRSIKK